MHSIGRKEKKKNLGVCPDGRRLILYIYIYIMIHYYDDGNGKKNKIALFYLFGVYPDK